MNKYNKKNSGDEFLKQKLEGFELPVEDFVFESIEAEISPVATPSKRKRGVLLWAIAGAMLPILITLLVVFNPFETPSLENSNNELEKIESTESELKLLRKDTSALKVASEKNRLNNIKPNNNQEGAEENLSNIKQTTRSTAAFNTLGQPAIVSTKKMKQATILNGSDKGLLNLSPNQNNQNIAENLSESQNITPNSLASNLNGQANAVKDKTSEKASAIADASNDNATNSIASYEATVPNLAEIVEPTSLDTSDVVNENTNFSNNVIAPKEEIPALSKFSLQALAGMGLSYRTLKNPAYKDLEIHKNENERYGVTYSLSLGAKYYINDVFYVGVGFGYASYSERYNFQNPTVSHSNINTYNYIQMPLTLGVRLFNTKRLALYGQMGMVWNSLTTAQSSWIDPTSLSPIGHSSMDQNHPFRENAFQSIIGIDIAIKLNNRWQLNLIPSANLFLNSVYLNSTNLDQKPYSGFLNIGVSRRF